MGSLSGLLKDVTVCIARSVDNDWEVEVGKGPRDSQVSSTIVAGILKCKAVKDAQYPLANFLTAALQMSLLHKVCAHSTFSST